PAASPWARATSTGSCRAPRASTGEPCGSSGRTPDRSRHAPPALLDRRTQERPSAGLRRDRSGGLRLLLVVLELVVVEVLRPLLEVFLEAGVPAELRLQRTVIGFGAEVLQLPGHLGVLRLLTAAPHA